MTLPGEAYLAVETPRTSTEDYRGCAIFGIIIAALIGLALCSKPSTQGPAELQSNGVENSAAGEAASPPPLQPLSMSAVRTGLRHLKLVHRLEGAIGDAIYSRNCYDALDRHFSWAKLDICGAFDMAAVQTGDPDVGGDPATYFEPEAAAGRYLGAATKAGEDSDDADRRLAKLQHSVPKAPVPPAPSTTKAPNDANAASNGLDEENQE